MTMNLRIDDRFVENEGWHRAQKNYQDFLRCHTQLSMLFLEMGTGYNTPGIIKYPFQQMVKTWPDAVYTCINLGQADAPEEMEEKSICINDDIGRVIQELL